MSDSAAENRAEMTRNLPVLVGPASARPSLARYQVPASFVSQLLAARQRVDSQRARNRAPAAVAVSAYRAGSAISVRRMPAGYRHAANA